MTSFIKGFFSVFSSLGNIKNYGVTKHLFLSGLVGLIIGVGIFATGYSLSDNIGSKLVEWYPFTWGVGFIESTADYVGGFLIVALGLILFKYLLLIINSPILSFVSEKVEYHLTDNMYAKEFSTLGVISDLMRGVVLSIKNFSKEIFYLIGITIASFIFPPAAPFLVVLSFLIQAYFAGFGNLDYFMERRFNVNQSNAIAKANKFGVMGIGSAFLVILMIPVLGWIFAPILATIAATEFGVDRGLDESLDL